MMSESTVPPPTQVTVTNAPAQQASVKTDPGQNPGGLSWIQINIAYFKTVPGILKIVQIILGIICMALAAPAYVGGTHWFLFVVVTSFIITLIWIFIYLLSIREALRLPINWILTELIYVGVITVLYAIAFIVQLSVSSHTYRRGSNFAAGAIGIINALAYAGSTYFLFLDWKGGINPQQ